MTQASDYTSLITSEHQKPKFLEMVSVLAQWAVDRQNLHQSIRGTEAIPGAVTLDVVPSADAVFYRNDWQGNQQLYPTPRTNNLIESQNFEVNSAWTIQNVSIGTAATTAPDGTNTGEKLQDTATTGFHSIQNNHNTLLANNKYTSSIFAQQADRQYLLLRMVSVGATGNYIAATFDLINGVAVVTNAGVGSGAVASMTKLAGTNWWRCTLTGTPDTAANSGVGLLVAAPMAYTNSTSYTGVAGQGIYIWGAQLEAGAVATSYIPTTTAPVTVTDYTVSPSGLVALVQVPVAAAQITWSGDATVLGSGGPVQASNALLGVGNGVTSQFQATLTWGSQPGIPEAPGLYDVDVAVGQQLDRVGEWIGRSRQLEIPLTDVYFSFDESGLGFDQGTWLGPFDPTTGLVSLPDDTYRILLYATIAANNWDGTIPSAYDAWNTIFEPLGYQILIQNNQDMTMSFVLMGPSPDAVTYALFTGGYLNLTPAGVGVDGYFIPTIPDTPVFGFDAENESISGFDEGCWVTGNSTQFPLLDVTFILNESVLS